MIGTLTHITIKAIKNEVKGKLKYWMNVMKIVSVIPRTAESFIEYIQM